VRENFSNLGAIVDGTEIRVPRPSDNELQKTVCSKKKHQHSVTVLLICTPRGHLIFASDPQTEASDQRHWNTLNLREYFEDKPYGVMGDSGFTFNHKRKPDEKQIIGYTPKKRPPKGQLEDKIYNKSLSRVRAVIENVSRCPRPQWRQSLRQTERARGTEGEERGSAGAGETARG
jgi:hypothetical protein